VRKALVRATALRVVENPEKLCCGVAAYWSGLLEHTDEGLRGV
jgi:hypothetical protein